MRTSLLKNNDYETAIEENGVSYKERQSKLPRVLLLGDSIRLSYQPIVADLLKGWAEVIGPDENCQFSLYTLASLERWIDELGKPDIIHWNNGIHDAGYNPDREPSQVPIEFYNSALNLTLERLRKLTPYIIWATSTPIHKDKPFRNDEWSWHNEEIEKYNRIAIQVMNVNNIPINDLHSLVSKNTDEYLCEDQIHLSETGQMACAEAVSRAIIAKYHAEFPDPETA